VYRDDCYELIPGEKAFGGNKARKLYHYVTNDFPQIATLVSYGSPQSNMLFSLSRLAQIKGWEFEFYVDHIPQNLVDNPRGNYARALQNGAKIKQVDAGNTQAWVEEYARNKPRYLYIPEGGRHANSEPGIAMLARDLEHWVTSSGLANPHLMLPSGTGTTACYIQKHVSFDVLTCPCVGSAGYLLDQFSELEPDRKVYPVILEVTGKYHFGKLYPEFLQIWQQLKTATEIEFDLLYDPLAWICMLDFARKNPGMDLIYLHQGGQSGNQTMLERYRYKKLLQ